MAASFTPQPELQQFAYNLSKNALLPAAQFKGAIHYEGRLQVRIDATTRAISMEPLDDTWAGTTIAENDIFAVEGGGRAVHGCWQLRAVVAGEERNVDPIDPSPEILASLPWAVSSDPIYPNRLRGVLDQVVDVRLSDTIFFGSNNHRGRGTLGDTPFSDSLRQLTFAGPVTGTPALGVVVTGGTSGGTGTVVGLSPGITQGGVGHWIIVDVGVDYAGAEFEAGEAITGDMAGTLAAAPLGARSISPLSPIGSERRSAPALIQVPATSATLQHFFDLSDAAGVFSDFAGTIPTGAGGDVRHIVNTGADGTPVTAVDVDATIPQYLHGVLNGQNVLSNVAGPASGDIAGTIAAGGGAAGASLIIVCRSRDATVLVDDMFRWFAIPGSIALFADKPSGRWEPTITDDANPATGKPVVLDEWIWAYVTADNATGDFRIRVSGSPELQLNTTYTPVPGGAFLRLLGDIGELAMAAVYDGPLSVAETDAWINDFITPKWGTLPA